MSYKNICLPILVLLSVLNTYSFPTTTLYKAIQGAKIPNCPAFRNTAANTPEPDYLKDCPYPLDPKSNDLNVIRCNLYLNQFNLVCELSSPKFTSPVFPSLEELQVAIPKDKLDPCEIFKMPIVINNNSNIDSFVTNKCKTICTDIRSDEVETICLAASYLRMVVTMLYMSEKKTGPVQIDSSGQAVQGIGQVKPALPQGVQPPEKLVEENREDSHNYGTSGNDVSSTGNAATDTAPTLTEPHRVLADNKPKLLEQHADVLGKGIGNVVISGGMETPEVVVNKTAAVAQKKATEITPIAVTPKSEEIPKANEAPKQKSQISAVPEQVTVSQPVDSKLIIAPVKNDATIVEDANQQDTAAEADYSEKGFDIDSAENNPPPELESNVPSVARKRPGMTEDEDEKMASRNMYRDERTVEDDSYFFTYFMMLCVVFIFAYVGYHNKQKIIAIVVEGRRGSSGGGRGGRSKGGRRPNSANYHKLDSNLEEAVSSNTSSKNTSKVIY